MQRGIAALQRYRPQQREALPKTRQRHRPGTLCSSGSQQAGGVAGEKDEEAGRHQPQTSPVLSSCTGGKGDRAAVS